MNKVSFLAIFFLLLVFNISVLAQDIFIYHGLDGATSVVDSKGNLISTADDMQGNIVIIREPGKEVRMKIINPNTLIYDYEFNNVILSESEELPDLSLFASAFNSLINQSKRTGDDTEGAGDNSDKISHLKDKEFRIYTEVIQSLQKELSSVKQYIIMSDTPESPVAAINDDYQENKGVRWLKEKLRTMESGTNKFNSKNLLQELNTLSDAATDDDVVKAIFKVYNADLVSKVDQFKKVIVKAPRTLNNEFQMKDETYSIRLIIKIKPEYIEDGQRDKDTIKLNVILKPMFKRPFIELLPIATVAYASDIPEYSLVNGIISQTKKDEFQFNAGSLLLFNAIKFGQMKEAALGAGVGFNIPKSGNIFNSLYVSTFLSYKQFLRFGVGVGYSEFISGLDGATVGGELPSNIENINDILTYDRKLAYFLSFSFVGLKISE